MEMGGREMIREVTMYQAVCDWCGKWNPTCKTKRKAMIIAMALKGWQEINGKLYCLGCYEYDEETDEYKPKVKED